MKNKTKQKKFEKKKRREQKRIAQRKQEKEFFLVKKASRAKGTTIRGKTHLIETKDTE